MYEEMRKSWKQWNVIILQNKLSSIAMSVHWMALLLLYAILRLSSLHFQVFSYSMKNFEHAHLNVCSRDAIVSTCKSFKEHFLICKHSVNILLKLSSFLLEINSLGQFSGFSISNNWCTYLSAQVLGANLKRL